MSVLADILSSIAERGKGLVDLDALSGASDKTKGLDALCERLLSGSGEASGLAVADRILQRFEDLDEAGRTAFFESLLHAFGPDLDKVRNAAETFIADPGEDAALTLHNVSEPRRQELIRRLNQASGGTRALIDMRSHLLRALKGHPELEPVDNDFRHLLASWFNRGFLELRRINWQTPAAILEKIIQYEAVHEITDWEDLRRRIDPPDRRLFAFFHPRLGDDPLIFVEVALTNAIPDAIEPILAPDREPVDPQRAKAAVFYSISNCQFGLRGISFGNFLIKQVVEDLRAEMSGLKWFVTLSPVPGFSRWLDRQAAAANDEKIRETLANIAEPHWWQDDAAGTAAKDVLMPLAAHYLVNARNDRGRVIDPVARFHLGNGARLERINWLADTGETSLQNAHGIMVNYLYKLDEIEKNHERFATDQTVAASAQVMKLAKGGGDLAAQMQAHLHE